MHWVAIQLPYQNSLAIITSILHTVLIWIWFIGKYSKYRSYSFNRYTQQKYSVNMIFSANVCITNGPYNITLFCKHTIHILLVKVDSSVIILFLTLFKINVNQNLSFYFSHKPGLIMTCLKTYELCSIHKLFN